MVTPPTRLIHLHATHDGNLVFLSFRGVGHGGAVFDGFLFVHQLPKISRQIRGTSSKSSRIKLGIMAIQKHRLVSFFMRAV